MKYKLIVCSFLFSCIPLLYGHKSAAEHERDILAVLGIYNANISADRTSVKIIPNDDNKKYRIRISPTIDIFARCIDNGTREIETGDLLLEKLLVVIKANKNCAFTSPNGKQYTHRVFFHWGFSSDPRHSKALTECLMVATNNNTELMEEGFKYIIKEQSKRNTKMYNAVDDLYKDRDRSKTHCRAFASLVYDTHILGDFIDGKLNSKNAIMQLDLLVVDIKNNVLRGMDYSGPKEDLDKIGKSLDRILKSCDTNEIKATKILIVLIESMPQIIKKSKTINLIVWGE